MQYRFFFIQFQCLLNAAYSIPHILPLGLFTVWFKGFKATAIQPLIALYAWNMHIFSIKCTLFTLHVTVYNVHSTVWSILCALYSLHCSLWLSIVHIYPHSAWTKEFMGQQSKWESSSFFFVSFVWFVGNLGYLGTLWTFLVYLWLLGICLIVGVTLIFIYAFYHWLTKGKLNEE